MESDCCEACNNLQGRDMIAAMVAYVAQKDAFFGSIQRGNDSPSQVDKERLVHDLYHRSPSVFITRYGRSLNDIHKQYLLKTYAESPDVLYQLKLLDKDQKHELSRVKNRRFTAMKIMMDSGDYFTDEEMKRRDPLLYEQMVGQYLTSEEIIDQSDALMKAHCGLSSILMEQMDSKDTEVLYTKQLEKQEEQMEESDDEDGEELEDDESKESAEVSDYEKQTKREEFLHIMQERFMAGEDKDFNYESVDDNCQYDDLIQESRDAEERYFDDDDDGGGGGDDDGGDDGDDGDDDDGDGGGNTPDTVTKKLKSAPLADEEYDY